MGTGGSGGDERLGARPLFTYTQAQLGLNLCTTLLGLHLLYFYSDRRGLSPALAGLGFFIALVLDALTDPLVGNISDGVRTRFGRRRPFFLAAIPMAACYFLLLAPPHLDRNLSLFVWFFVFYFLMLTAAKIYGTAYAALMPELTLDYDDRTRLSTFRQLFGTAGDISGALIPFAASWLFARGTDFKVTGACAGLIVAGGALAVLFGIRERPGFAERERMGLVQSLKSAAGNRPFVILLAATALSLMAINIPAVLIRFVAKYWMHDDDAAARWLIAYFIGSVISYPFWFRITLLIEKKPAYIVAMVANALSLLLFLLVSPADTWTIYLLMVFSGFTAIGIWVTQIAASGDVIEWDEERTGRRQEGAYAGLTSMAAKFAVAITMLLLGPVMGWAGYSAGHVLPQAGENLLRIYAIGPAAIFGLSALVFSRYPITRAAHRAMRERLAAKAAAEPATGTSP